MTLATFRDGWVGAATFRDGWVGAATFRDGWVGAVRAEPGVLRGGAELRVREC